ncbi:FAD-dependent oxidoreductase [Vibrio sinensis]|uniref:3-oxosteroid 1-dehydrogenase n=1 Tax=Vibrio sinensis TaxID=2302434 RepID=A0A3A6QZB5_9VIBR|nr:FAD-dependent oxidoreductase [Vibrio sinensis]RJX68901.1 FAD-dependent oxidoreductase [Vibrio sinensis]
MKHEQSSISSQQEFDVVVVGSGAGAMSTAIFASDKGLSVAVIEKTDQYGGTSALSGGGIWIPNNDHFRAKGGNDSKALALEYLQNSTEGEVDITTLDAYLDNAPKMIRYLEKHTPVRYEVAEKYPDYYPHLSGSLPGGRTLDPELFDTSRLGDEIHTMRKASRSTLLMGKIAWTARDAHKAMARERGWRLLLIRRMLRYKFDFRQRRQGKRDRWAGLGSSLIAALRKGMLDRNIPLLLNTELTDLVVENNRVVGVQTKQQGEPLVLKANKAVVLASGGFEQNQELREKYLGAPTKTSWSATPKGANAGAGLEAGIRHGAATNLLDWCWWAPTLSVPNENESRGVFAERAFPGAIVVNGLGKRFYNEAAPYLEFGHAMYQDNLETGGKTIPAWVVFDAKFRFNYAMGPLMPGQIMPDARLPAAWNENLYWKADTLEELAQRIGIEADGLKETVAKMNEFAQTGVDTDFGRGGNVFDRYYGDLNVKPNPCLAPIGKGPYYAMKLNAGDIGTKGGLVIDDNARVLSENNTHIEGLYAIGNCSASVMGKSYPGAGSTLGPAMTFGYIAANHIAANQDAKRDTAGFVTQGASTEAQAEAQAECE